MSKYVHIHKTVSQECNEMFYLKYLRINLQPHYMMYHSTKSRNYIDNPGHVTM